MPQNIDPYTKLLIHGDGVVDDWQIKDQCGNLITNTGVTYSTTNAKFGKGSMRFSVGEADKLYAGSFYIGTNDFSVSFWIKFNSSTTPQRLFSLGNGSTSTTGLTFHWESTSSGQFQINGNVMFGWAMDTTSWHHVLVSRTYSPNETRVFVDGVKLGNTSTYFSSAIASAASPMYVGTWLTASTYPLDAYITDIQLTLGKTIYNSDASFTPPTMPAKGRKGWY